MEDVGADYWRGTVKGVDQRVAAGAVVPASPAYKRLIMGCDRIFPELEVGGLSDPKGKGKRRPRYARLLSHLRMGPLPELVEYDVGLSNTAAWQERGPHTNCGGGGPR